MRSNRLPPAGAPYEHVREPNTNVVRHACELSNSVRAAIHDRGIPEHAHVKIVDLHGVDAMNAPLEYLRKHLRPSAH